MKVIQVSCEEVYKQVNYRIELKVNGKKVIVEKGYTQDRCFETYDDDFDILPESEALTEEEEEELWDFLYSPNLELK